MKDQLRREWIALMQEGGHGQATRFRLRAMRLAQLMRSTDPELAAAVTLGLAETSTLTRLAPATVGMADMPDLLSIESEPVLPGTPYWPRTVAAELRQIVHEWQSQDALTAADLHPIKTGSTPFSRTVELRP